LKANAANIQSSKPGYTSARMLLYQEFPQAFTFIKKGRYWKPRHRGFAIGRMYFAHPSSGERFYLWLLLTVVYGPTSFEDIQTYNGILYPTFKATCLARGLLEDDREWIQCINEAAAMQSGSQLRSLFVVILRENQPSQLEHLWEQFKDKLCDDLNYALHNQGFAEPSIADVHDYGLYLLEKLLNQEGRSLEEFPPMPLPIGNWGNLEGNQLIAEQLAYNSQEQAHLAEPRIPMLNSEQHTAFTAVYQSIVQNQGQTFFLNGPAGTGKKFVYNTLSNKLHGEQKIVLCVASSEIAALLITGGRTSHSTFKIPIDIGPESICSIKPQTMIAELMKEASLIIWDKVPMQHHWCAEAVDRTLCDIRQLENSPFGGLTVVFGGDFQQILPVVPKGGQEDIVGACIQHSPLWANIHLLYLKQNMRLNHGAEEIQFSKWLLDVGHGQHTGAGGTFHLPASMKCGNSKQSLIDSYYPGLSQLHPELDHDNYFLVRTILSPKNIEVHSLNSDILSTFPRHEEVFHSADSVVTEGGVDGDFQYPVEYLNSINVPGLPCSKLTLKVGCPIMVLCNLDAANGVCNGSQAVILHMSHRVLEVRLIGGQHQGKKAFIPRITLTPSNAGLPFHLKCHQFPIQLAFAMTINKSQG
jgi:hypothetical protein